MKPHKLCWNQSTSTESLLFSQFLVVCLQFLEEKRNKVQIITDLSEFSICADFQHQEEFNKDIKLINVMDAP